MKKSKETELKHHARRVSIKEGIFATVKNSFGSHYVSPFAIAINASNSMVAMFGSISGLLGPFSQIFGSRLMEKYSRKKIVTKTVFIDALTWIFYLAIAFLYLKGILITSLPLLLLILFSVHIFIHSLGIPSWYSWMGDIVDKKYRGRWFAKRHLITGVVTAVLTIISACLLDLFKKQGFLMWGFIIFFFIAFVGRLICWRLFKKQYEPKTKIETKSYFSFTSFLIQAPKNNFGRFAIFRSLLSFATSIAGPLLAVYLLRELGFSYSIYMIVTLFGAGISLTLLGLWGQLSDKYGNYFVLKLTAIFIPIIPILWILHPSPIYLLLVPSLTSGIAWAGFNLVATNFIYDNVTPQKRGFAFSYFSMLNGIGVFLGAGLGAILIKVLNINLIKPIFVIFIISAFVRLFVIGLMLPKVKEIRKIKKTPSIKILPHIIMKDLKSSLHEEIHDVVEIKNYLRE